ncbi:sterol 3-beta-glucosyltransferase UGT80B1 isoform X2 [Asparagus officinalis]|nr:sterol 3-beta-glucosyltransferase UGT80B1 isoform X2 [Asparagus officinalis]
MPISTPPVLSVHQASTCADSELQSFSTRKKMIRTQHRQECLSADSESMPGDFIVINFFALEGWSLAELYQVQCVVAAPYVLPYSAPSSFERQFRHEFPLLFKYFQEAPAEKVSWKDVQHWMWPLFSEDWGSWRSDCLNLSPLPFMDPVTNLPMWHMRAQSPLLLYGFSKKIVECPGYWPSNVHVCGFWFLPVEWQFSCDRCREIVPSHSHEYPIKKSLLCADHSDLYHFLGKTSSPGLPIFIGLSSIGSMGFFQNPRAFLLVLKAVIDSTGYRFILFSAGYEPLDAAIQMTADGSSNSTKLQHSMYCKHLLFNDCLFCFSGTLPYSWLFPRCAVVIHHGGSGSTAAALYAGTPQIICPFILDQFYWAERLYWLGVAPEPLRKAQLVPDSEDARSIKQAGDALSAAIKHALSPEMKDQASRVSERISSEAGVDEVLKILRDNVVHPHKGEECIV